MTEVQATGTVHFTGHYEGTPTPQLDVTITNPRGDLRWRNRDGLRRCLQQSVLTGEPESFPNAEFAAARHQRVIPGFSSEAVTMTAIPAKLTEEGSEAFAGFYSEGTVLDPVIPDRYLRADAAAGRTEKRSAEARRSGPGFQPRR